MSSGRGRAIVASRESGISSHPIAHLLISPALWAGLAVSGALLFGVVRLRRARGAM
jgi:hypothetical protein